MNINLKIEDLTTNVKIIKDKKAEKELVEKLAERISEALTQNPEISEKANKIGKSKLKSMAIELLENFIADQEKKQIGDALEISNKINNTLISSLINGIEEFSKKF